MREETSGNKIKLVSGTIFCISFLYVAGALIFFLIASSNVEEMRYHDTYVVVGDWSAILALAILFISAICFLFSSKLGSYFAKIK